MEIKITRKSTPSSDSLKCVILSLTLLICLGGTNGLPSTLDTISNATESHTNSSGSHVSVRLEVNDRLVFGSGHICDGSLIASSVVLTAAHCLWNENKHLFYSASELSVVMGNVDRTVNNTNTLKLSVKEIKTIAAFNHSTFQDDIAILILSEDVPKNYSSASIIQMNENRNLTVGTKCTVSGWITSLKGNNTNKLVSVDLPLANKTLCTTNYGAQTNMDGMLCAGSASGVVQECQGDSGAALVCGHKLVGILALGTGCGISDYPAVFTDVSYYSEKISNKLPSTQSQSSGMSLPNVGAIPVPMPFPGNQGTPVTQVAQGNQTTQGNSTLPNVGAITVPLQSQGTQGIQGAQGTQGNQTTQGNSTLPNVGAIPVPMQSHGAQGTTQATHGNSTLPKESNYALYRRNTTWHSNSTYHQGSSSYHPGSSYYPGSYHPGSSHHHGSTHRRRNGSMSIYCRNFVWLLIFSFFGLTKLL